VATQARRFDAEPPLVRERNVWAGVRLWTGALAFLFVSFVFAFFYLRSLNNNNMWRDSAANPPRVFGTIVLACVVVGVVVYGFAVRSLRTQGEGGWRRLAILAFLLLLAALVVQSVEFYHAGFGTKDGGYASVFFGWTGFYAAALLGALYWLWTQVAQSLRGPGPAGGGDGSHVLQLADREAVAFFLYFLAVVQVVLYVLLYLIA
jgi:heme/copper-type cytochrome/quinol oxidase subunit 3